MIDLILQSLGLFMLLLVGYIVLFRLRYVYYPDKKPWWLWPLVGLFLALDAFINITVMTFLMLDTPKEWLLTARLKRYKKLKPKGWREWMHYKVANNICLILNIFDPKGHC
jgi:hypothetical protein